MNKIIALFLIGIQTAFAGLPPTSVQGQSDATPQTKFNFQVPYNQKTDLGGTKALFETGNKDLLSNASFENVIFNTAWTNTASTPTVDTTNVHDGKQSALMTMSSQQGLISNDVTPTVQLSGTNLEYGAWVKTTLTNVQVCARQAAATVGTCAAVPSTGNWQYVSVNYPGPASGSVGVSVGMTGSGTGTFNVDDAYVGVARNLSQVSQAQFFGSVQITACSGSWSYTGSGFSDYSVQTSCNYATAGNAQAPATMIPAIKFASMPPGNYILQYEGQIQSGTTGQQCQWQFWDGTNTAIEKSNFGNLNILGNGITQSITYTTPQSNVTLSIRAQAFGTSTCNLTGTNTLPGVIKVYYFPSQSQTAVNSNAAPQPFLTVAGNPATFAANAPIIYPNVVKDTNFAYNASTGQYTAPLTGFYSVCAGIADNSTNPILFAYVGGVQQSPAIGASSSALSNPSGCGMVSVTVGQTIDVRESFASGSIVSSATNGLTIGYIGQQLVPTPILVGSVTNSAPAALRLDAANLNQTTAGGGNVCSVLTQIGGASWISLSSSGSAGICNWTLATGEFSAAPSCNCTSSGVATSSCTATVNSATSITTTTYLASTPKSEQGISIQCMGPR